MENTMAEFKAYAPDGTVHTYSSAIDQHHACVLAGYTLAPPGEAEARGADPMRNYANLSQEDVRKLCASRRIKGYVSMKREAQIAALEAYDEAVAAKLEQPTKKAAPKKGAADGTE
jgi:hypothetical protein